jgi:LmbE family N-acetylglucosaminyl deacetylase
MHWIYLSPHLDDVGLSIGGLVWEQVQAGETVEIWSIFAGDPPPPPYTPFAAELHARWGTDGAAASALRRAEDRAACGILGAGWRHSPLPDCIYRRLPETGEPVIGERDDLFRPYPPGEGYLVAQIAAWIRASLSEEARLVSPMTLGGHIDHLLVRAAAEALEIPVLFYADYPYAVDDPLRHTDLRAKSTEDYPALVKGLSFQAVSAWQEAVAAYASQISSFWDSQEEMRAKIGTYFQEGGGTTLWCKATA